MNILPSNNDLTDGNFDKNDINLVGKGYQWNLCTSLLKKFVHSNKRRVLIIQGEEGYGLSPFINNFEKRAYYEGCSVCIGKIPDNTSLSPFAIYDNLLREVIKITVNEKRKQERQRHKRNLESLMEENEEENSSVNSSQPKINNFKLIGKKTNLKRLYGPRSALRNGKTKKSVSSQVSFDQSVLSNEDELDSEVMSDSAKEDRKKIKKKTTFADDVQGSIITPNTEIKNFNGNSFEEDILEALFYLDEREEIAPLLNIIYYNRFETTNEVKIINKKMVFYELCNLICRLLTKLSFITPLVIILDNAHLQDYFSWKLTSMIFKRCTRLFLCICTRPRSFYTSPELKLITKEIWNSLHTSVVTLDSYSEIDTQKFLILYYNEVKKIKYDMKKCCKVDNNLVINIWKLTEGNPLFTLRIARSLFYGNDLCSLNDDLALVLKEPFQELEINNHCGSMKDILLYQIQTLDPKFKDFLFLASLMNRQYFSFETINRFVEIYKDKNKICKSVHEFINQDDLCYKSYDKYEYLKKFFVFKKDERTGDKDIENKSNSNYSNSFSNSSNLKLEDSNNDLPVGLDNSNYEITFSFNGKLIKDVLYENESIDDRLELHEMYAQYVEERDSSECYILFYHYSNTTNYDKMIYYLSQLCHIMYKMGASYLATEAYEVLLKLYGENIDPDNNSTNNKSNNDDENKDLLNIVSKARKTAKDPIDKIKPSTKPPKYQLARMFYELGNCYYGLSKYRNAELYFLKTLDYLDYKFPEKNVSLVVRLIKETKKREQLKNQSEKEKTSAKEGEIERIKKMISEIKDPDEKKKELLKYKKEIENGSLSLCQKSLFMLYEVYNIYHKSIHSQIALLLALNDPSSSESSFAYAEIIAKYGLELVWVSSTANSGWNYLNEAENIINPENGELPILKMTRTHLLVYDALAVANIFLKSWSKGKHYVDIIIKLSQQTGDTEIWARGTLLKSLLYFQSGAIDKSFRLAKDVYNNSNERNIWKSQCTALLVVLQYFGVKESSDMIYTPLNVINIAFNIQSKITSSNNEDVVLYVGLMLDACFRFKVPIDNIFDYVKKAIQCLDKLEPSCYYCIFSYPQYVITLFLFYELGYFKKSSPFSDISNQLLTSTLNAMDLFKETQIVQPLIAMLKGLTSLIQGNVNNAMIAWETGAKKAKRSQFFGAMLYSKLAQYGIGEIKERSASIVKKLLEKINASFDLDIIKEWEIVPFKPIKARKN